MIAIWRAGLRRWLAPGLGVALTVAWCVAGAPAPPAAAATTTIAVNGTQGGRTFDGIGAISGGGGNTRLLTDYPATQQQQILDYLFKPGYGADLQILKAEIGGDTNSTDGSESSIEHASGSINCGAGYEWWLMEQAKARNPNIKLYGLAWGAPGWIGSTFWSTNTINYIVAWLNCAASHGLTINYLGGWNERGYNISWYEQLRSTLNADGYSAVQIVGADSDWTIANDLVSNPTFASAVQIVGAHYPCGYLSSESSCPSTANAVATGKQLWASENGSQDFNSGAAAMARADQPGLPRRADDRDDQLAGRGRDLPRPAVQHRRPDRGQPALVRRVHRRQATVGHRADHAVHRAGLDLHQLGQRLPAGHSRRRQLRHAQVAQRVRLELDHRDHGRHRRADRHLQHLRRPLHRDRACLEHERELGQLVELVRALLRHHPERRQLLADRPARVRVLADHHHRAGQGHRGQPGPGTLALPYSDSFDSDTAGQQPRYLAQQQGAFEVEPCAGGRSGQCLQQQAAVKPIEWAGDANPYTIGGNLSWANYTVAADVLIQQAGAVQLLGRVSTQKGFSPADIDAYYFQVANTGAWSIFRNNTSGTITTLASGTVAALGTGTWHHLALSLNGHTISGAIDGTTVGTVSDSTFTDGMAGLGVNGYQTDQFDNLAVTALGSATPTGPIIAGDNTAKCVDDNTGSSANGTKVQMWDCNGTAAQNWTIETDGTIRINGSCMDITGAGTANGTLVELWTCNGGGNQQWLPVNGMLVNPVSGRCLDDPGFTTTNGTQLDIWDCNGGSNQQWAIP